MLDQAGQRVAELGWNNVELIQRDAAQYTFPTSVDGILSTFALSLIPGPDLIIKNGAAALNPGKRWVVLDLKMPSNWLRYLWPVVLPIVKPFAVTETLIERQPWTVIRHAMQVNLSYVTFENLYLGFVFIAVGERVNVLDE